MPRQFYPVEHFSVPQAEYKLLPFRFLKLNADREILVNEVGEFILAPVGTAQRVIRRQLDRTSELFSTLKAKQFLTDGSSSALLDLLATKYRTKHHFLEGFTKQYDVNRLVYFESFAQIKNAILREKQIKSWRREKKLALIRSTNPAFRDLSFDFHKI